MQRQCMRITPWPRIMQGHHRTRSKRLKIGRRERGIMHHIQAQAPQHKREPELFDDQLIGGWADHGIESILEWHEIWMDFACEKENVAYAGFGLLQQEQVPGNF